MWNFLYHFSVLDLIKPFVKKLPNPLYRRWTEETGNYGHKQNKEIYARPRSNSPETELETEIDSIKIKIFEKKERFVSFQSFW